MKYQFLNFLRFFASLIIMVFHVNNNWIAYQSIPELFRNGYTWVFFFFMISGFLMATKKNQIDNPYKYVWHKLVKIYPVYFLGLIIMLILNHDKLTKIHLISSLTLTQAFTLNYLPFTDPSWYLSALLFLSFIFPFLDSLFRKNRLLSFGLSFAVVIYTDWIIRVISNTKGIPKNLGSFANLNYLQKFTPFMFIGVILVGISINYVSKRFSSHRGFSIATIITMILMPIVYKNLFPHHYYLRNILIFLPLVFFISLDSGFLNSICKHRVFLFLGKLSMPIFILHIPIKTILVKFSGGLSNNNMFLLYYLLVILVAIVIVNIQDYFLKIRSQKFNYLLKD